MSSMHQTMLLWCNLHLFTLWECPTRPNLIVLTLDPHRVIQLRHSGKISFVPHQTSATRSAWPHPETRWPKWTGLCEADRVKPPKEGPGSQKCRPSSIHSLPSEAWISLNAKKSLTCLTVCIWQASEWSSEVALVKITFGSIKPLSGGASQRCALLNSALDDNFHPRYLLPFKGLFFKV